MSGNQDLLIQNENERLRYIKLHYKQEAEKLKNEHDKQRRLLDDDLQIKRNEISRLEDEINRLEEEIECLKNALGILRDAESAKFDYDEMCRRLDAELEKKRNDITRLETETLQTHPWLAVQFADWQQTYDMTLVNQLLQKTRSAPKKASEVERIVRGELRETRIKAKQEEYQRRFYEELFPWLLEFKEVPPEEAYQDVTETQDASDEEQLFIQRGYLSHEEYITLSDTERNQLALDRYIKKEKTPWQIGIEYERYIGWKYEQEGYSVSYNGATMGIEDMGRDLIAEKDGRVLIIQCKRWAREKTIHEKHIFQLAGSVFEYRFHHPSYQVSGVFVTTTSFSPIAKECGELLGIEMKANTPFCEYPRIKCNIGRDENGLVTKIYHLPMDQQYDSVKIDSPGEFYAHTIAEAEAHGFRRAYRWLNK